MILIQFFPFQWMGGNNALRQAGKILQALNVPMSAGAVVNWSRKNKEKQIKSAAAAVTEVFSGV